MANKKYYWLKLKEDFFEEDAIAWLEEQEKGKEYTLFYLKLCLKSLKSNGLLIRNVGSMLVPYDAKTLAKITNTDIDTVKVAMDIFTKIGLVQILENGEIFITQLENMVGSETKWAEKKRLQRSKNKSLDNVPLLSGKSPREIEKEKEIEKEIDIEQQHIDKNFVVVVDKIKEFFTLEDVDIKKVASAHLATKKEIGYLIEKLQIAKSTDTKNLVGFLIEAIKKDYKPIITNNQEKKTKTKFHNCNNAFDKFTPDELEDFLLEQQKNKWEQ